MENLTDKIKWLRKNPQHDAKLPVVGSASKPHCWGKMKWILKYPSGMEPPHAICRCEHGSLKCKLLTRQVAR
jgi:hypothetical protein